MEGKERLAGNIKLLKKFRINYPKELEQVADTIVAVAVNNQFAGHITIADEVKEDAKQAPMTEFLTTAPGSEELLKIMCPLGRIGTTMEIAYGALYLASDESSYTTGVELVIDGGLTAR